MSKVNRRGFLKGIMAGTAATVVAKQTAEASQDEKLEQVKIHTKKPHVGLSGATAFSAAYWPETHK